MKQITSILFILLSTSLFAQNTAFTRSLKGVQQVTIQVNSDITIVAKSSGNSLSIRNATKADCETQVEDCTYPTRTFFSHHTKKHDSLKVVKAKGLVPIYPDGKDETNGFGFKIEQKGTGLLVKDLKSRLQGKPVVIELPQNIMISVKSRSNSAVSLRGFSSEISVQCPHGNIKLSAITGPVTAYTSIGNITVDFSMLNQASPTSLSTVGGEIDVTLPKNSNADLSVETRGMVYSDLNLKDKKNSKTPKNSHSRKILRAMNNGGVAINIKSSLGNVYLRKK